MLGVALEGDEDTVAYQRKREGRAALPFSCSLMGAGHTSLARGIIALATALLGVHLNFDALDLGGFRFGQVQLQHTLMVGGPHLGRVHLNG